MPVGATAYGRAKQRHNTLANVNASNPVLAAAEFMAAVDGDEIVLRMGDGATHWVDLENILPHPEAGGGGGGGPLGYGQAYPTGMTITPGAGAAQAVPTSWNDADGLIVPGSFGWGFAEAGWYQVVVKIWAGFAAEGDIPALLRCTLQTYDYAEVIGDYAVLPPAVAGDAGMGTTTSRSLPGVIATMTSAVFEQAGSDVTGTNACQIRLGWDDDGAILKSATGSDPRYALSAEITRLA